MNIKQKLEHALAFGYPVKVMWERSGEEGLVYATTLSGFKFHGDQYERKYAFVLSVEPLEEVEKAENNTDELIAEYKSLLGEIQTSLGFLKEAQEKIGDTDSVSEDDSGKLSILDEKWGIREEGSDPRILDERGDAVLVADWRPELSAAPDAFRALVGIRDRTGGLGAVSRVLKKAGVE